MCVCMDVYIAPTLHLSFFISSRVGKSILPEQRKDTLVLIGWRIPVVLGGWRPYLGSHLGYLVACNHSDLQAACFPEPTLSRRAGARSANISHGLGACFGFSTFTHHKGSWDHECFPRASSVPACAGSSLMSSSHNAPAGWSYYS